MASIYVVEDDENIREIETFALKNSGYTVTAFECAKDFYSKIASKVPWFLTVIVYQIETMIIAKSKTK